MSTSYTISDGPKMLRETLCAAAQSLIGNSNLNDDHRTEHVNRLQRLINQCDMHRPIDSDGKHGEMHTMTCGCER